MRRLAALSLFLCAQFAGADYWVSVGSFPRAEPAAKLAKTATQKVGIEFSARAFETGAGTAYRVVAGPHGDAAGADGERAKAVGAGYADAWVVPPRASVGVGAAVVAAPTAPAVAPVGQASDANLPAVDYGIDSDPLLEELLGDDLLLSDEELLGEDYLTDFSDDQSVEEWLKAIEAEAAQSLEATTPAQPQPRTVPATPEALPEELGEPPPEDYGAHRLRRGSAMHSPSEPSAPIAPPAPRNRATPAKAAPSAVPLSPMPAEPMPAEEHLVAARMAAGTQGAGEVAAPGPFDAAAPPSSAAPLPEEEHFVQAAAISLLAADEHIPLARRGNDARVRIDGQLDDDAWGELAVHDRFVSVDPDTLRPSDLPTRVRIFYNDRGLYVGADMVQDPETLVQVLSSRDKYLRRDYFSFTLDTSGEGRYGYWFQVSLGGSVSDGTILPERQFSNTWDGAWHGASARTETGWSAEFFIPWSLVSMPRHAGDRAMGLYASRMIAYRDERLGWPALPFTLPQFMSAFQKLALSEVNPRQQYSATPYVSTTQDMVAGQTGRKAGLDVYWRPSSNFQLTSTLNPDFGNVEADDVIVNLSRYETFFPEKRLFFQEGQEIFTTNSRFMADTVMLHTRRIGSAPLRPDVPDDVVLDASEFRRPSDVLGALKATGQQGAFRFGLLGAAEDAGEFQALDAEGAAMTLTSPGRDYGAARLLYEHANGGYQALGWMSTAVTHPSREAYVHAVDGHFVSPGGTWTADAQVLQSEVDGGERGAGGIVDINFMPSKGQRHMLSVDVFDDKVDVRDMGYLRRNDLRKFRYRYRFSRSGMERLREVRTYLFTTGAWNGVGRMVGAGLGVDQRLTLTNLSQLRFTGDLMPRQYDDWSSPGRAFRVGDQWNTEVRYESDPSRRISWILRHLWGEEELGDATRRTQGFVTWRPSDRLTMNLGVGVRDRDAWLLHRGSGRFVAYEAEELAPNLDFDFFLTARQHFRLALQWVAIKADGQRAFMAPDSAGDLVPQAAPDHASDDFALSRMNFQLRYRWELAPLSDLFVVYTTNAGLSGDGDSEYLRHDYSRMFSDTWEETLGEQLVVKLRYRLGS